MAPKSCRKQKQKVLVFYLTKKQRQLSTSAVDVVMTETNKLDISKKNISENLTSPERCF